MRIVLLSAFLMVSIGVARCPAAPVRILDVPDSVRSGKSFSFDILLPATTQLAAYQIDVLLSGSAGSVGSGYEYDSAMVVLPGEGYVFPSNTSFFSTKLSDSTGTERMVLTDFHLSGVDTVIGANDRIATVLVETLPNYEGVLELKIDADALILDGPNLTPTSVPEFDSIVADTRGQSVISVNVTAIPEPNTVLILCGALTCLLLGGRKTRRPKAECN